MDIAILQWIQTTMASPVMGTLMPTVSMLGNNGALWIVLAALMIASKKHREYGILMLAALAAVFLIGDCVIKPLVARPRPFIADPGIQLLIAAPSDYSFPSGHASTAFAAFVVLCFSRVHWPWKVVFFVFSVVISFSRLYLCVHYPTDVLAGLILGVVVGLATVFIGRRIYEDRAMKAKAEEK